ncbi:hypothetical protein KKH23_01005 [Patescibacteria group bacterium]|nr:hypothetical protein [Patescibacteria group bacterium]MBU0777071.1 hypothetical protein [Patescibacteria group bacterium]MBU0845765.1 hypothetical protein [Patescibacteria group bacterium]MBU0922791.1 hypothetical protein [Patescibacteria group bacterium]MBU1066475.1 hypothetical protein [Patescibacteria group bacterium]
MKKFFSALLTGFALFFSIPSVLILASWNALPGTGLYSVKSSFEDVALALTANTPIATAFSVNFTDRRYSEAVRLLDKEGSTVGYQLLVAEAQQTQSMVLNRKDVKNGAQLIRKIGEYQAEIEEKQAEVQSLASTPTTVDQVPSPTPYVDPYPTTSDSDKTVTVTVPVEIVIEEEDTEEVLENLEDALEELEEIKDDIEEELPDVIFEGISEDTEDILEDEEAAEEEESDKDKKDKERPLKY